jgi:hypothetical protein
LAQRPCGGIARLERLGDAAGRGVPHAARRGDGRGAARRCTG